MSFSVSQPDPVITFTVDVWPENSCGSAGSVKQTSDDGYIIAGCKDDKAWLLKLDMYGNQLWENTYNLMDYWGTKSVIQTSDGGYLFAGWVGIVKVDSTGEQEWKNEEHPNGMGAYPYYEDIIEHSNGKYYAVGGPGNDGQALIVKFSHDGEVLKRKWHGGNCDNDRFKSVIESPDSMLIMVGGKVHGNSGYPCSFEWYDDFWIVKTNRNGSKIWEQTYGGSYYEEAHDIVRIEGGGYGIIGEKCANTPSNCLDATKVFFIQIDDDGNKVGDDKYQRNGFSTGNSITTTAQDGIAWTGDAGSYDTWVYKWGENEEQVDFVTDGVGGVNIETTTDGGFIIGTWGGTLIKTDSEFNFDETTSIDNNITMPSSLILSQNHPNPFNPVTTLRYNLPEDAMVNITIYDMMGRVVSNLVSSQQRAGYKSVQWNATNNTGQPVSAGLYLYTIEAGQFRQTKKMVLLK